jgi:methyl acetate hydrolase
MDARLNPQFQAAVNSKLVPGIGGLIMSKSGDVDWKGTWGTTNIDDASAPSFTEHTPILIFSMTKLVASVAALQLVEQGKLGLDDLAEKYVPKITEIQVLDGFEEDGTPKLRAAKKKPTIKHLMTHTSGLSYDFFDPDTLRWRLATGRSPGMYFTGEYANIASPFLSEPGEKYIYGVGIDWLGLVVEAISGVTLPEYIHKHILSPLKMTNSGVQQPAGTRKLDVHMRMGDKLAAVPEFTHMFPAEVHGGGSYLFSTIHDYSQFLLAILNDGEHPVYKERILKPETVQSYLFTDQISQIHPRPDSSGVGVIGTAVPQTSLPAEFLPGVEKTWSLGMMVNTQDCPKGRKAGSGFWCGVTNTYFFVDPAAEKLAVFATSVLPFCDPQVLHLWDEMERAAYGHESKKEIGEKGGNHVCLPLSQQETSTA